MHKYYRVEYYNKAVNYNGQIEFYNLEDAIQSAKKVEALPEMSSVHLYRIEEIAFK